MKYAASRFHHTSSLNFQHVERKVHEVNSLQVTVKRDVSCISTTAFKSMIYIVYIARTIRGATNRVN